MLTLTSLLTLWLFIDKFCPLGLKHLLLTVFQMSTNHIVFFWLHITVLAACFHGSLKRKVLNAGLTAESKYRNTECRSTHLNWNLKVSPLFEKNFIHTEKFSAMILAALLRSRLWPHITEGKVYMYVFITRKDVRKNFWITPQLLSNDKLFTG